MKRREFLLTGLGLAAGAGCASMTNPFKASLPDTSGMNVLFINIEDCTTAGIGCYGNPIPKTPNIDGLAATGVRFANAFCASPACNPSRSSYLTGLRPETTGVLGNEFRIEDVLPDGVLTLPELMKNAGFYTANSGKLFHQSHGAAPYLLAYDRIENADKPPEEWQGMTVPQAVKAARALERKKPVFDEEKRKKYTFYADRYGDSGLDEEDDPDYKIYSSAVDIIEDCAANNRHFFLSVGSHKPHTPLICPKKYVDMFDPDDIPLPKAPPEEDEGIPGLAVRWHKNGDIFVNRTATEQQTREAIAAYYACTAFIDAQVGRVLDTLERTGLADNTIVIFMADHGFHLGEHGLWSKFTLFDQSVRAPFIIRVPEAPANGQACEELIEFVDILPTLTELCDLQPTQDFEGVSFAPLLVDPDRPWKEAVFPVLQMGRTIGHSVRTKRWKLNEWNPDDPSLDELYDLKNDPWETKNLAHDPRYAEVAARMKKMLHEGWEPVQRAINGKGRA